MIRSLREVAIVFLGSLLLFLIQPIAGQRLLAPYGGSPAVWLACLMFFQSMVFLGYVWGFLLTRFSSLWVQIGLQSILLSVTVLRHWPVVVSGDALFPGADGWLQWEPIKVGLSLTGDLFLPVICLTSVSPIIQFWGSRIAGRRPPYWLYSISNLASLLALALYPFWIQSRWDLPQQLSIWSLLFAIYAALFAWNMIAVQWETQGNRSAVEMLKMDAPESASSGLVLIWFTASMLPSMLLMALSNQIGSDVAAGPLFWTLPLASYLGTFSLAFAWHYRPPGFAMLTVLGLLALVVGPILSPWLPAWVTVAIGCVALFVVAWACHLELVRHQPTADHLPTYYLWIAAGGMVGGILINLVAPLVFSNFYELELTVLATAFFLAVTGWISSSSQNGNPKQSTRWSAAGTMATFVALGLVTFVVMIGLIRKYPFRQLGNGRQLLVQQRTFHGVLRILEKETPQGKVRTFGHGWTDHGRSLVGTDRVVFPSGYYSVGSGLSVAFTLLREGKVDGLDVCVLGLGAGNLLRWKQANDRFVFVEIDPEVIRLQHQYFADPLRDRNVQFVAGDARQFLSSLGSQHYDLIVMDAFTGDSVPSHLLTREAFDVYLEHCRMGGIMAIHVSNRYLDFHPVVARMAKENDLELLAISFVPPADEVGQILQVWQSAGWGWVAPARDWVREVTDVTYDGRQSDWILLSRVPFPSEFKAMGHATAADQFPASADETSLWRDDFAPLLPLMK